MTSPATTSKCGWDERKTASERTVLQWTATKTADTKDTDWDPKQKASASNGPSDRGILAH